ncbi:MAG: lamin tail domain-containing protein [Myxococcales bacterium]|nr:lamin tail domain-containing protein [Myxococcales bacterium]
MLVLLTSSFAGVLINEVVYNPSGADGGLEWIELCNNGATAVALDGYTIRSGGTSFATSFTLSAAGSIAPGEYVVVGFGSTTWPGAFNDNLENGGSVADGVQLVDGSGTVLDTLLYDGSAGGLLDDLGRAEPAAAGVGEGQSLGRFDGTTDCVDTDDSAADFVEYATPTPAAANGDPNPGTGGNADCTAAADVRLNELLSNPSGTDTGLEWVELHNRGTAAVDVSGWVVRGATKSTGGSSAVLPGDTVIAAGGFLVVGAGGLGSITLGNGTGGDGAYLLCDDVVLDSVVYGDDNADALLDDWGIPATSLAEIPGESVSLSRRTDGEDTDQSADDWTSSSVNTPGAANQTPQCVSEGAEGLRLNEVLYDPTEDDDTYEFVELYNAGDVTIQLEGYVLDAAKSDWSDNAILPAGAVLEPGEFYVIGGGDVENQDYSAAGLDLGNGTDGDGVRVSSCDGVLLDTVLYGGAEGDELVGDGGATDVVDKVSAGSSIGRFPDGQDSDAHTDWVAYSSPSPGEANADPAAIDTGDDTGNGTGDGPIEPGCGPNPDSPDGAACATARLPLHGLEGVVALLVLARRRRL